MPCMAELPPARVVCRSWLPLLKPPCIPPCCSIIQTNIGNHIGWRARGFYLLFGPWLKTPDQGAATTVYAATAGGCPEAWHG